MTRAQGAHSNTPGGSRGPASPTPRGTHSKITDPKQDAYGDAHGAGGHRHVWYLFGGIAVALLVSGTIVGMRILGSTGADSVQTDSRASTSGIVDGADASLQDQEEEPVSSEAATAASPATSTLPTDAVTLDVPTVTQLPELPSGCEITAATADLDYYGFDVSNVELNEFLAQGWDDYNPHESFVGYCESEGWMCYAEPIVDAIDAYLASVGDTTYAAEDITGTPAEDLYTYYVAKGTPVIVWVTTYLQEREVVESWTIDDEEVTVSEQDHCMVLIGYTDDTVILMDPLDDRVEYSKEEFEASYDSRGDRAVIIQGAAS